MLTVYPIYGNFVHENNPLMFPLCKDYLIWEKMKDIVMTPSEMGKARD